MKGDHPPLARTTSIPLRVIIGEQPSIEGWLQDDEGSPHVPSVLERFLERRPSADAVSAKGLLTPTTPTGTGRDGPSSRSRSVSAVDDGSCTLDRWLDDDEGIPHIPNALAEFMRRRPSREEVVDQGVLKSHIQQTSDLLKRRTIAAKLESEIQTRASVEKLIEKGIYFPPQE